MNSLSKNNVDYIRIVEELRENISDVIESDTKFDDDFFLVQWLKRFSFKVDRTGAMIRESIEWRKTNDIDRLAHVNISTEFPGLSQEFPIYVDARSKNGLPVITVNGNGIDFVTLIKKYGKETFLRYVYCCVIIRGEQTVLKQIQKLKNENENYSLVDFVTSTEVGVIAIASFKDISLWIAKSPIIAQVLFEGAKAAAGYFPVFVNQVYFINANKIIAAIFKLIKPIIASPYYSVECHGLEKSKWSSVLLENIEPSQLTPEFGGNKILKV